MVAHKAWNKNSARKQAKEARKKGFKAVIYKKKTGWGVSVTTKKK